MKTCKYLILLFYISISANVISQNTNDRFSLRYYLVQTPTYIISEFNNCRIESPLKLNKKTGLESLSLTCNQGNFSKEISYLLFFKNGLCSQIGYFPNPITNDSGIRYTSEIKLLQKEGWELVENKSDDGGNIFRTYTKDNVSLTLSYAPFAGLLSFSIN